LAAIEPYGIAIIAVILFVALIWAYLKDMFGFGDSSRQANLAPNPNDIAAECLIIKKTPNPVQHEFGVPLSYIYINSQGWTFERYPGNGIILRDADGNTIAEDPAAYIVDWDDDPVYTEGTIVSSVAEISDLSNQDDWVIYRNFDWE